MELKRTGQVELIKRTGYVEMKRTKHMKLKRTGQVELLKRNGRGTEADEGWTCETESDEDWMCRTAADEDSTCGTEAECETEATEDSIEDWMNWLIHCRCARIQTVYDLYAVAPCIIYPRGFSRKFTNFY